MLEGRRRKTVRECHNCGAMDPPYWRNVRYRIFTMCCHIDDLRFNSPSLATVLIEHRKKHPKTKEDITIASYIYHYMPKSGIVQRIHVSDSRDGKSIREPEQEKHFSRWVVVGQTQLCEGGAEP